MEKKASDSDPLTFEDELKVCIYSQEEDDEGTEAAGMRKKGLRSHNTLEHYTVQELTEAGCFSMEYSMNIFEGVEHSVYSQECSSTQVSAMNTSQQYPCAKQNQGVLTETDLMQYADPLYYAPKSQEKKKGISKFHSPQKLHEGLEENPAPGIVNKRIEGNGSMSFAFGEAYDNYALQHNSCHSNNSNCVKGISVNEALCETKRNNGCQYVAMKENILNVDDINSPKNSNMSITSTLGSEADCSSDSNLLKAWKEMDYHHQKWSKQCYKPINKKISPKKLYENYHLESKKDKSLKITIQNMQHTGQPSASHKVRTESQEQTTNQTVMPYFEAAPSPLHDGGCQRSALPICDLAKSHSSATAGFATSPSNFNTVKENLSYEGTDSNWFVGWNEDNRPKNKNTDPTWIISDELENEYSRETDSISLEEWNTAPFGAVKRHQEEKNSTSLSLRKTPRRSLDWPPCSSSTTSETSAHPFKDLGAGPQSWRKTPRRSLDWPPCSSSSTTSEISAHPFKDLGAGPLSWRKTPRRSLDWPPCSSSSTTSETNVHPFKDLGAGVLSWREVPRPSMDWPQYNPLSKLFQNKGKADFDDRKLLQKCFTPGFIDTHCHLDFLFERIKHGGSYSKFREDTKDPFPVSYEGCVTIFCKPWTFRKISWWEKMIMEPNIWAAFGCHPHFADSYEEEGEVYLQLALLNSKTVALGEIGLDYSKRNHVQHGTQKEVLRRQLKIALNCMKPVIIHCRDAHKDCIDIMKEILPRSYRIHLHCFTGNWNQAEEWLETFSGLFLGITNLINNSKDLRWYHLHMAVKKIPLGRLLLETDAPYFCPAFLQDAGQNSHPGMALYVAAQVAHLKGVEVQAVLTHARDNTKQMYGI